MKGRAEPLVHQGRMQPGAMARHGITATDLVEAARQSGAADERQIAFAFLVPNGRISVIKS